MKKELIVVENINVPGYTAKVNAIVYRAMKSVLLKILPSEEPGLIQSEMMKAVVPNLSQNLFPDGANQAGG